MHVLTLPLIQGVPSVKVLLRKPFLFAVVQAVNPVLVSTIRVENGGAVEAVPLPGEDPPLGAVLFDESGSPLTV